MIERVPTRNSAIPVYFRNWLTYSIIPQLSSSLFLCLSGVRLAKREKNIFFSILAYMPLCFNVSVLISLSLSLFFFIWHNAATTFLELWKRRQAVIVWEWDLQNADYDEEPRPEFEASVKTFRINPVTKEREPYLPAWSKAIRYLATGSMVFFMVIILHISLCVFLGMQYYYIIVIILVYFYI